MSTLAHPRLDSRAPDDLPGSRRAPLHAALPAEPEASLWTRLRHPFARRAPTARSLIRKHRLWPAMELAYDEVVREFGSARVEISAESDPDGFPYVRLNFQVPRLEMEPLLEFASVLRAGVRERFGSIGSPHLTITINPARPSLRRVS